MLLLQNARRKRLHRIFFLNPDRLLQNNDAVIDRLIHEMNGTSSDLAPYSNACFCASRPGNAGSSDGCTFRIRFGNARTNSGVMTRM